ncbi:MAG: hypothetical protein KDD64_08035 [Bdellovibrionales bacterium]|nr:hypothetical protein [Bdellovibrionales bacterium]
MEPEQNSLRLQPTERGFLYGEFSDVNGATCSIQESSLATAGAIWLGPNESRDGALRTPNRMHLGPDQLIQLIGPLARFAVRGEGIEQPLLFCDLYGVPSCLMAHDNGQILFGVVLPKRADGSKLIRHDSNFYGNQRDPERSQAVKLLFDDLREGRSDFLDVDSRMTLNRGMVRPLIGPFRQMIAEGERRSIELRNFEF